MVKKLFVVAALVAGCSTALGVMAASASRAVQTAATQTFSPGPEQTFTLPSAGRLDVVVVAGTGGNNAQNDGFGGYYGGGGGGSCDTSCGTYGAGAGSGSSWVMAGALNVTYGNDTSATPRVQVTYTPKIHKV